MSLDVLLNTYGHHHPDHLSDAVPALRRHHRPNDVVRIGDVIESVNHPALDRIGRRPEGRRRWVLSLGEEAGSSAATARPLAPPRKIAPSLNEQPRTQIGLFEIDGNAIIACSDTSAAASLFSEGRW